MLIFVNTALVKLQLLTTMFHHHQRTSKSLLSAAILALLLLTSCKDAGSASKTNSTSSPNQAIAKTVKESKKKPAKLDRKQVQAIKSVLQENVRAFNQEDLDAFIATIDPKSPSFYSTINLMRKLFPAYDLRADISNIEVLNISGNEAKVRLVQTTRKIKGPEFQNNRLVALHTLKKSNGKWKLFSLQEENIEYLK